MNNSNNRFPNGKHHDRSDPAYIEAALSAATEQGDTVLGIETILPPQTFEELQMIIEIGRETEGGETHVADLVLQQLMAELAEYPDRDTIVKQLPYDYRPPAGVWLILPGIDFM
jgi:hypothetical protein